jgi:hypothetical protein
MGVRYDEKSVKWWRNCPSNSVRQFHNKGLY